MRGLSAVVAVPFLAGMAVLCSAGDKDSKEADEVKWDKLPKAVQQGVEKVLMQHLLAGETVKVGAFEKKDKDTWEVESVIDGKPVDFYVAADGTFAGTEGPEDEEKEAKGAYLGIKLGDSKKGVQVGGVMPESPAARAGFQEKDVIESVGDVTVKGPEELLQELSKHKPGDKVKIGVLRNGKEKELSVTLGERPKAEAGEEDEGGEGDEGDEGGEGDEKD